MLDETPAFKKLTVEQNQEHGGQSGDRLELAGTRQGCLLSTFHAGAVSLHSSENPSDSPP